MHLWYGSLTMISSHLHVNPVDLLILFFFFLPGDRHCQVCACQPWVRPVCFSFKSKMCIANLTDDLSLVGPASYLAPLGSKSIARLSCCAGTTGAEGPRVTCSLVPCAVRVWVSPTLRRLSSPSPHVWSTIQFGELLHRHVWPRNSIFFSVKLQSPALVIFSVDFSKVYAWLKHISLSSCALFSAPMERFSLDLCILQFNGSYWALFRAEGRNFRFFFILDG